MNKQEFEYKLARLVEALEQGLEEEARNDPTCIYPDCDNCGECFFRESLKIAEELHNFTLGQ